MSCVIFCLALCLTVCHRLNTDLAVRHANALRKRMGFSLDGPASVSMTGDAAALAAAVRAICDAVGLTLKVADEVPADAAAKAAALDAARAAKDFAAADALRAELQADGWTVETTKAGTTLRR